MDRWLRSKIQIQLSRAKPLVSPTTGGQTGHVI
jgi:hypothetical protein